MKIFKSAFILILLLLLLTGCGNKENTVNDTTNTQRLSTPPTNNIVNQMPDVSVTNSIYENNTNITNDVQTVELNETKKEDTEEEISSFSTDILTDDNDRENNIEITCSKINEYVVEPGDTFSFTKTVGKATHDKGYEEANVFDANGNTIKGLGGGNCQVSSTLYNAVLEADGLEVVERHPHSSKVYYVPEGKDAAVAYGSVDFKFKNNNDYSIKIYAESDSKEVRIKLTKLS